MYDVTYPLFPIASFLGFVAVLTPLPWHLEAWNSGTCYYMIWTAIACLNQFINSVVWADDAINRAPVWCDISSRIILAASIGIPASSLCVMRRLHSISRIHAVATSREDKRRGVIIDSLICVFFPMVSLVLAYIVQGHRFNLLEQVGCYPDIYNTVLAYFLQAWWPVVLGLISVVYCGLTIYNFLKRQAQFTQFLSSNKVLTASRYFRLMALACVEMMFTTPVAIYFICLNVTAQPLQPWVSWEDTHYNFSRVVQTPAVLWRANVYAEIAVESTRWASPICALLFFLFFGFAEESRKNYAKIFSRILTTCHLRRDEDPISTKSSSLKRLALTSTVRSSQVSLPVYSIPPPVYQSSESGISPPTSPDEKHFMPLASPRTTSEFSFTAYDNQDKGHSIRPASSTATAASRTSNTSVVDLVV